MYYNPKHRNETAGTTETTGTTETKPPEQPNSPKSPEIQLKGVTHRTQVLFAAIILTYLPSQEINGRSPRELFVPPIPVLSKRTVVVIFVPMLIVF